MGQKVHNFNLPNSHIYTELSLYTTQWSARKKFSTRANYSLLGCVCQVNWIAVPFAWSTPIPMQRLTWVSFPEERICPFLLHFLSSVTYCVKRGTLLVPSPSWCCRTSSCNVAPQSSFTVLNKWVQSEVNCELFVPHCSGTLPHHMVLRWMIANAWGNVTCSTVQ